MSISRDRFFGGAIAISTSTALSPASPSVISCHNGTSINVTLPAHDRFREWQVGKDRFLIMAHGAGSVVVIHNGVTLATITSGQASTVHVLAEDYLVQAVGPIGGPRTASRAGRYPVDNLSTSSTFVGDCFEGSGCDLAIANGLEPLDGQEGRDQCIVPMCQDVTHATNSGREPIRANDVVMPSVVVLQFNRDEFEADPAHPLAGTVLPTAFYEALYNNDRPHALLYEGRVDGTTRHPHHLRWIGSEPSQQWTHGTGAGNFSITRHRWSKTVTYTDENDATFTVTLHFIAEHTLSSEPGPDPFEDPGSQQDRNKGAWGTVFSIYVFCNQLSPSFANGNTFTPVGAGAPVAFSLNDPFVSGIAYGVGEGEEDKLCHPQLVLVGHLPMTFHSPMGSSHIPWEERQWLRTWGSDAFTTRGANREFCHKVRNGSPWIDPGDCDGSYPRDDIDNDDIFGNVVFGWDTPSHNGAAMSLGGEFTRSKPLEFIAWENGRGEGRTYLVPTKPGWDEDCGTLDVAGGSSGSIWICTEDEYGIDDGTGRRTWPLAALVECDGHPDEPFEGIGGGHNCFNNGNLADDGALVNCCITTNATATAQVTDQCIRISTAYGSLDFGGCVLGEQTCESSSQTFTALLEPEDYDYMMNGDQASRVISWTRLLPDPSFVANDYVHTGTDSELNDLHGTWNFATSTITGQGGSHATVVKALAIFDDTIDPVIEDYVVHFSTTNGKTVPQGPAARTGVNGSSQISGYFCRLQSTGGSNGTATILRIVDDVEVTLATKNITNFTSESVAFALDMWGDTITFTWTVSGQSADSLTAKDCRLVTGEGGLAVYSTGTASMGSISLDDEEKDFITIDGTHARFSNLFSWPSTIPEERADFLSNCNAINTNPGCGTPPNCNCTTVSGTATSETTVSWSGVDLSAPDGRDVNVSVCTGPPDYDGDGENPTYAGAPNPRCDCDGPWCGSDAPQCGTCPEPWVSISLHLPTCWPSEVRDEDGIEEPLMCSGVSLWSYSSSACS